MQIYLAGPISDGDNPYAWHQRVKETAPDVDWVNPFTLHDFPADSVRNHTDEIIEKDLEAVRSSDAVLLRRIPDYNLCGASIEAREAYDHNIPVVVWNTAETEVPLFLAGHCTEICNSLEMAVSTVKEIIETE